MKKIFAALLRRWAHALNPETPATLPPGHEVVKVVSRKAFTFPDGKMPDAATVEGIKRAMTEEILSRIDTRFIRYRADLAPIPGGLIEYSASLYIGFKPKKKVKP